MLLSTAYSTKIHAVVRDITTIQADAIVNAANVTLLGGGGVDGAVHRAAGPRLRDFCQSLPEVEPGVRCRVGDAVATPGFQLSVKHVIHTVGPMFPGSRDPAYQGEFSRDYDPKERLANCFRSTLTLARENQVKTILLPAISCGVFGCPLAICARIARNVLHQENWGLRLAVFCLFTTPDYSAFTETWRMEEKCES